MISIILNGREQSFDVEADMPLLWLKKKLAFVVQNLVAALHNVAPAQ
jgi:hypothetical protein